MIRYYFSPLMWAGIILFLSSIPAKELPDISFWKWLSFDKIAHAVLYSVFSFQIMRSCIRQYANWNLRYYAPQVAIGISIAYGAAIEIYQEMMLTDRNGEWMDMISNAIGAILGVWIFKIIFYQYIR